MATQKTPGVYNTEKNSFITSAVEVASAIPAFIGHTEKSEHSYWALTHMPCRITSLLEYIDCFGGAPKPEFALIESAPIEDGNPEVSPQTQKHILVREKGKYLLYYSMLLYFVNGGGPCYIVSVGDYDTTPDKDLFVRGIDLLTTEREPTILVIPETVLLPDLISDTEVHMAMLAHCGTMKNRFAILDIREGFRDRKDPEGDRITDFRESIGTDFLEYGSAYYPWVNTSIVQEKDLSFRNIVTLDALKAMLTQELIPEGEVMDEAKSDVLLEMLEGLTNPKLSESEKSILHTRLLSLSPQYKEMIRAMNADLNLLPPGAAMAGVYAMVDDSRGVWKAPANIGLNAVLSPTVNLTGTEQEDLNTPLNGKAVNAIRAFPGEGTLVWGARTLNGNSLDWRYINVRRAVIMIEESIRLAISSFVFEPNDANTWGTVKSMIERFLTNIRERKGIAGTVPEESFIVKVGLGETMTPEDILEGILRITVLVALSRPAEFIELTFEQKMKES